MTKRAHHVRRISVLLIITVILASYIVIALTRPLPALAVHITPPVVPTAITPTFPWPSYGQSAFGVVGYGLLATHNTQTAVPMASTAKILTALTILQKKPLTLGQQGPAITITDQDVQYYNDYMSMDGSVVQVTAGEQISEYQALQAMLLPSANNIAETLGVWAYGSNDAFLAAANSLASTLGAPNTHLIDASGFDPGSVSTATDLVLLGLKAMSDPVIAEIVGQTSANIPVEGEIHNVNVMLGHDGINGIKTGNTDQAGGVFLASAKILIDGQPTVAVSAIMSAPDLGTALVDSGPLLAAAPAAFGAAIITTTGQQVGTATAAWGASTKLVAQKGINITHWKGTALTAVVSKPVAVSTLKTGQAIASIAVTSSTKTYNSAIITSSAVTKPSVWWRLQHAL
jgi:D-alanyl-D-alanine carboxypeptidase (penicillin-binding protein 5/6)